MNGLLGLCCFSFVGIFVDFALLLDAVGTNSSGKNCGDILDGFGDGSVGTIEEAAGAMLHCSLGS